MLTIVLFFFYLKIWCFPWQSFQIAFLSSAKSLINNTFTIKVLMNGLKLWNAVSVVLHIVLLKHFLNQINDLCEIFFKMFIQFALWKNLKSLEVSNFFGWPRPRQLYNYSLEYVSHIYIISCKASKILQRSQQKPEYWIDFISSPSKATGCPKTLSQSNN